MFITFTTNTGAVKHVNLNNVNYISTYLTDGIMIFQYNDDNNIVLVANDDSQDWYITRAKFDELAAKISTIIQTQCTVN